MAHLESFHCSRQVTCKKNKKLSKEMKKTLPLKDEEVKFIAINDINELNEIKAAS